MSHADLPLFEWTPPCRVIVFPITRRVGRIRDVAVKMLDKPTERAAVSYRDQVLSNLLKHLDRLGVPADVQDEQLRAFWEAVNCEMIRLNYAGHGAGGAA